MKRKRTMHSTRESLLHYLTTMPVYNDTTEQTFIDDVLYGLGLALSTPERQFKFADGYTHFKAVLRAHISPEGAGIARSDASPSPRASSEPTLGHTDQDTPEPDHE